MSTVATAVSEVNPAISQLDVTIEAHKADLRWQLKSIAFALDRFEFEEERKGNPRAIAGLAPSKWGPLPADIETLYDCQELLASELYCLDDWSQEEAAWRTMAAALPPVEAGAQ
jgi:hypothetical protein